LWQSVNAEIGATSRRLRVDGLTSYHYDQWPRLWLLGELSHLGGCVYPGFSDLLFHRTCNGSLRVQIVSR